MGMKEKLGIDPLEFWSAFAGFVVFVGLGLESGPEIWKAIVTRTLPSRADIGSVLVAFGVFAEVVIGIAIARKSKMAEIEANDRIAELKKRAAEAELARARIEEELFKPHVLTPEMQDEWRELLKEFSGSTKRVDVFMYDQHIPEAFTLADSINAVFLSAGWISKLWLGDDPRMIGTEVTFITSIELGSTDDKSLQILAGKLCATLFIAGIGCSFGVADIRHLAKKPAGGWSGAWDPQDIAPFRIQVGQRQIRPEFSNVRADILATKKK